MSSEFVESIDSFKIIFAGKSSIEAELFTKTINNTIDLVKSSANAISPNCFLKLEINANREGSFETVLDAVIKHTPDLLTCSSIATNIIQGFLNFLLIKQHLKGNKPKKIDKINDEVAILNQDNAILKVPQSIGNAYFTNSNIDNVIVNIANNLRDSDRENIIVETKQDKIVINKGEYDSMAAPVVTEQNLVVTTERQKPVDVNLLLKKPDLLGKSQWEFVYNKTISAKILDQEFLELVHKGKIKKLYAGVRIPCLLQIEYDLDEYYNPVPNSDRYTILKVTGDLIEPDDEKILNLF